MTGFFGADVEQLDSLAFALEREGRDLESLIRRLDARLQSVEWKGPDAERSRSQWTTSLLPRCLQAAEGLVSAAGVVRRNASEQRQASGGAALLRPAVPFPVPIPGIPKIPGVYRLPGSGFASPGELIPTMPGLHPGLRPIDKFPRIDIATTWPGSVWTPADFFAPTREALQSRIPGTPWTWGSIGGLVPGAKDVLAVRDMADQMSQGKIPLHNMVDTAAGALRKAPPTYLLGAAVGTWNTVFKELGKADFSAQTRSSVGDYVSSDPWGAVSAGSEAVVSFIPNLIKNFL